VVALLPSLFAVRTLLPAVPRLVRVRDPATVVEASETVPPDCVSAFWKVEEPATKVCPLLELDEVAEARVL